MTLIPNPKPIAERVVQSDVPPMINAAIADIETAVTNTTEAVEGFQNDLDEILDGIEINPSLVGAQKRASSVQAMTLLEGLSVGENVYVDSRACYFRLDSTVRGKYYRTVPTHTNALKYNPTASHPLETLTPGSTIEVTLRCSPDFAYTAPIDILIGVKGCGFTKISGTIRFAIHTAGGNLGSDRLRIKSLKDATGRELKDASDLSVGDLSGDKWYKVVLEVHTGNISITGSNVYTFGTINAAGVYVDYRSVTITKQSGEKLSWDFGVGLSSLEDVAEVMTTTGATIAYDMPLLHNGYNIIESVVVDPPSYKLFTLVSDDNFVTPQNFGGQPQIGTLNTSDDIDITEILEAIHDLTNYNIRILGGQSYYVKGHPKVPGEMYPVGMSITRPMTIELQGRSSGSGVDASNGLASRYTELAAGVLYTGKDPIDLFHIFTAGVTIKGGMIDLQNTKYTLAKNPSLTDWHTLTPYYVPPKVFTYFSWYNNILHANIETTIRGTRSDSQDFNGGHIGIFFDVTRTTSKDPQTWTFGEMHNGVFKIDALNIYAPFYGRNDEPWQDYSNPEVLARTLPSHDVRFGGFDRPEATEDDGTYYIDSPPSTDFDVTSGRSRWFTMRWGTDKILSILVPYASNTNPNFIRAINNEILRAGFSQDLAGVDPAFIAETHPDGSPGRSFRLRSNQDFSLRCYFPPSNNGHEFNIFSWFCKTIHIGTGGTSSWYINFQPGTNLVEGTLEEEFPCVTIQSNAGFMNLQTVDVGRESGTPGLIFNKRAFDEIGSGTVFSDHTFTAMDVSVPNRSDINPVNVPGYIRNHRRFFQTRYGSQGSDNGFIGALDNFLYYAGSRYTVTINTYDNDGTFDFATPLPAVGRPGVIVNNSLTTFTLNNPTGMFTDESSQTPIRYESGFDQEKDFIEVVITGMPVTIVPLGYYLEWNSSFNTPRSFQIIQIPSSADAGQITVDMTRLTRTWHWVNTLTTNGGATIILRFIGCKNKISNFELIQFAGRSRNFQNENKPFVSIGGGQRVYGNMDFDSLKILAGGSHRKITPQAEGTNTTISDLVTKLKAAGTLY